MVEIISGLSGEQLGGEAELQVEIPVDNPAPIIEPADTWPNSMTPHFSPLGNYLAAVTLENGQIDKGWVKFSTYELHDANSVVDFIAKRLTGNGRKIVDIQIIERRPLGEKIN